MVGNLNPMGTLKMTENSQKSAIPHSPPMVLDTPHESPLSAILAESPKGTIIDPWGNSSLLMRHDRGEKLQGEGIMSKYIRRDPEEYNLARGSADGEFFIHNCGKHKSTLFDTVRGSCLACEAEMRTTGIAPRLAASLIGADHYDSVCATHGPTLFNVRLAACVACRAPKPIGRPASVRSEARRAGERHYAAPCDTHGPTAPHWVSHGRCSECFTAMGAARRR
jgi:hypothetical protein